MVADTLSEVLRGVRLTRAAFFAHDSATAAGDASPRQGFSASRLMPDVEHVIECHVVTAGACWAGLFDGAKTRLEAGDVVVFPQGSAPGRPASLSTERGDASGAQIVSGLLGCEARPFHPLLSTLPRVMHVRCANQSDSALGRLVEVALLESRSPKSGSGCVLSRLGELLFAEVVRRYVATLPAESAGWFAGLRDENIGRALQELHQRPAHPWSLEVLAKEVGMSRSMLAERFAELVGVPPIQYLAQWRIQLAASLLRASTSSVAEVAERVGYGSEAALSRAFKRRIGLSPAYYRRARLGAAPVGPASSGRRPVGQQECVGF